MATLKHCCGAECRLAVTGTASAGVEHISAINGTPTVDTTVFNAAGRGLAAHKFNDANVWMEHTFASVIASTATGVASFAFRVLSGVLNNDENTDIIRFYNGSLVIGGINVKDTSGACQVATFAGSTEGTYTTISYDTWYWCDVKVATGATVITSARINGWVDLSVASEAGAASSLSKVRWGCCTSSVWNPTVWIDDLSVSGTSGDYTLMGPGGVLGLYPNADGTHGGGWASGVFGKSTGGATAAQNNNTDLWTNLDNPLVATAAGTWLSDLTGVAVTNYVEIAFDNVPAAVLTIVGVEAVATSHSATTTTSTFDLRLADSTGGAAASFMAALDLSETTITIPCAVLASDRSGNAWNATRINDARVRFSSTDSNPDVYLDGVMLEVAFAEFSRDLTPAAVASSAVALTVTPGAASRDLTPAVVTASPVALTPAPGGVALLLVDWSECGPFSPEDIAGLVGAWDFSDTGLITEAAGAVSQVDGAYGTTEAATQGTGARQPTTGTRTINGLNALDFGGDDGLETAVSASDRTQTIFVVALKDGAAGVTLLGTSAAQGRNIYVWSDNIAYISMFGSYNMSTFNGFTVPTGTPFLLTLAASASNFIWRGDGGSEETDSESTALTAGRTSQIGMDTGSTNWWDGTIGEVLIYDTQLGSTDRDAVEAYLMAKWGL